MSSLTPGIVEELVLHFFDSHGRDGGARSELRRTRRKALP
jgi:hypothetical protein